MKYSFIAVIVLLILQGCSTGTKTAIEETTISPPVKTDRPVRVIPLEPSDFALSMGITAENYPIIDGSTSTFPLVQEIYKRMFQPRIFVAEGWAPDDAVRPQEAVYDGMPEKPSQTMPSYDKLIAGDVDLILVPDPSEEAKRKAAAAGVELEYIQIGADGLVFITSKKNPVEAITIEQIVEIYTQQSIRNWSTLGGHDGRLVALSRNKDSGSQAAMENLVLRGTPIHSNIRESRDRVVTGMGPMIRQVEGYERSANDGAQNMYTLGYTVFYYLPQFQAREERPLEVKMLAVDGVAPTAATIASKEYPLVIGGFAVIRKNEPADSPARKIANWLLSDEGQRVVLNSGLGTLRTVKD